MIPQIRVGIGYDAHRFDPNRPLILGGLKISESDGLAGHSDADVVVHAICDALFGAAGLPDIGRNYPDSDERFRNVRSTELLRDTVTQLRENGWQVGNVDAVIVAEKPKIAPYADRMATELATILAVKPNQVNIKATTTERMGFTGRGEGISAMATVLIMALTEKSGNEFSEIPV